MYGSGFEPRVSGWKVQANKSYCVWFKIQNNKYALDQLGLVKQYTECTLHHMKLGVLFPCLE